LPGRGVKELRAHDCDSHPRLGGQVAEGVRRWGIDGGAPAEDHEVDEHLATLNELGER